MLFKTFTPSLALTQFVTNYICVEGENATTVAPPRKTAGIAFRFGDEKNNSKETLITMRSFIKQIVTYPSVHLINIHDCVGLDIVEGYYQIIFVHLNPLGIHHLLRRHTNDLVNQIIPFEELVPSVTPVLQRMAEVKGFEEKIKIVEPFLIQNFEKSRYKESDMDTAIHLINQSQGNIKVKNIQQQCKVSERTLERKFREQLGFSPKEYARIIRFKNMMQYMLLHPKTAWAELAYHFGYADQSHLSKDFQYFAAVNPEKFMENDFSIEKIFSKVV